ncbi:galactosyl transferase [Rhizobium calliandrae]|uniref:Galactosyl transferase n=1 Tax=Rhizobium calliandrae TaxID=1312182 RepID=A0ABT7KD18_9HYPH|nr:galactosyl transferase [Rhizobium calliandrae]MDL2406513.1 galactosyl transferase [Rhizobium calliandrae]
MSLITFIIPVRHQANAKDWPALKERLTQTVASIAGQYHRDWRGVIVANEGADLPDLPPQFSVARVTFPPNQHHEMQSADKEKVYDAFRLDKGRRVLSGMLAARDSRFFMIVDDDDFVSANIVDHIAGQPDANGWKIDKGYLWNEGGRLVMQHDDFANFCGTSLIVRSRLYELPATFEDASADYVKSMLGSHVRIAGILAKRGTPLGMLPFRGAIYRVGHSGAHSQSSSLLTSHFFSPYALRHPRQLVRNLLRIRPLDRALRSEFFGAALEHPRFQVEAPASG